MHSQHTPYRTTCAILTTVQRVWKRVDNKSCHVQTNIRERWVGRSTFIQWGMLKGRLVELKVEMPPIHISMTSPTVTSSLRQRGSEVKGQSCCAFTLLLRGEESGEEPSAEEVRGKWLDVLLLERGFSAPAEDWKWIPMFLPDWEVHFMIDEPRKEKSRQ